MQSVCSANPVSRGQAAFGVASLSLGGGVVSSYLFLAQNFRLFAKDATPSGPLAG